MKDSLNKVIAALREEREQVSAQEQRAQAPHRPRPQAIDAGAPQGQCAEVAGGEERRAKAEAISVASGRQQLEGHHEHQGSDEGRHAPGQALVR